VASSIKYNKLLTLDAKGLQRIYYLNSSTLSIVELKMTARDTGFPLSTLCTTVDSGLGRGTANIQLHIQLHSNTKRNLKRNTQLQYCLLPKKSKDTAQEQRCINASLQPLLYGNDDCNNVFNLKDSGIWKQEKMPAFFVELLCSSSLLTFNTHKTSESNYELSE